MIVDAKPYAAMKASGALWLQDVPSHWAVLPNRALFVEVRDRNGPDETMLSVTIAQGVTPQSTLLADSSKRDSSNQDKAAYKCVQVGDIVYNKMRAWQGAIGASNYGGIVSPAYVVQRPRISATAQYFHYLFRTPPFAKEAERWSYGITSDMWSLRPEHFRMIYSCCPPLSEQNQIVRFIDYVDGRLRTAIRAQQALISLLNEQIRAITARAVTRGLDPDVEFKTPHYAHAACVPVHWEVLALKRVLCELIDCEHRTAPFTSVSDYRVVRTAAIRNGRLRSEGTYCTTFEGYSDWTRRGRPVVGDVFFTREAPVGEACLVPSEGQYCLGQRTVLMRPRPDRYDSQFLVHMIYGGPPADRIAQASQGSTVDHFNMDDIARMTVLAPPLAEQQAIVRHIGIATQKMRHAEGRAAREIDLLREFRTRLIVDVVTGKLDIRAVADRLPALEDEPDPLDDSEDEFDHSGNSREEIEA